MGARVGLQQKLAVDLSVALRGRKARVSEQLLDRPQIGAGAEQMRGEGVPERMRRRSVWQPKRAPRPGNHELDDAGLKRHAAHADEQRIV
jgi:hypothetical protein